MFYRQQLVVISSWAQLGAKAPIQKIVYMEMSDCKTKGLAKELCEFVLMGNFTHLLSQ